MSQNLFKYLSPSKIRVFGYCPYLGPQYTDDDRDQWFSIMQSLLRNHEDIIDDKEKDIEEDSHQLLYQYMNDHHDEKWAAAKNLLDTIHENKAKNKKTTQAVNNSLKALLETSDIDILKIYALLYPNHYITQFRSQKSRQLRPIQCVDTDLDNLMTAVSKSKRTLTDSYDAEKILLDLSKNDWTEIPRIGRYYGTWNKLTLHDQTERKYEAILYNWSLMGKSPDKQQIDALILELDKRKSFKYGQYWRSGVLHFKIDFFDKITNDAIASADKKTIVTEASTLPKWKDQIDHSYIKVLVPIAIATMCKRQKWERKGLINAIIAEIDLPMLNTTKSHLGRIVDKLMIHTM